MRKLVALLTVSLTLAGCAKDNIIPDNDEIRLKSSIENVTQSKAPHDATINGVDGNFDVCVFASKTSGNYTALYGNGIMRFVTLGTSLGSEKGFTSDGTTATPKYYPLDGTSIYLFGVYPGASGITWSISSTYASSEGIIDGKNDVMAAPQVSGTKSSAVPILALEHLLTKLEFYLHADNGAGVNAAARESEVTAKWGRILKIEVIGAGGGASPSLNTNIKVNFDGTFDNIAPVTNFTNPVASITAYRYDHTAAAGSKYTNTPFDFTAENGIFIRSFDIEPSDDQTQYMAGYVMVSPIEESNPYNIYTLKVTTEKAGVINNINVSLKNNMGDDYTNYTQGKSFKIFLNFKLAEVRANTTITAWDPVGYGNIDLEAV